ncbi:MAG: sarcosine oxidase subunit beta family protein [Alphaproteobacteria bacterium]
MQRYSIFSLIKNAFSGHNNWEEAWTSPEPKKEYDVIIIGAGGHGLATAYHLAKEYNITNVAVLEKGHLGSGNIGRNTTIVRSNYLLDGNVQFYEHSVKLWERMSKDLNFNVMFSQRGILNLAHSPGQMDSYARRGNSMRINGIDAELLNREQVAKFVPNLNMDNERFPIVGGLLQPRAGTARHDAVAWGYARAAAALGVDIIENCEVIGFDIEKGKVKGVKTTRGDIKAKKVGMAVAGSTSLVAEKAGLKLPIESHVLQAFVSEPYKPLIDTVVTFGAGHLYISQSDKGGLVFGGNIDFYNSYAQRGNLPIVEEVASEAVTLFPQLKRLKLLRHWGGIMDMSMDGSPIIDKTHIDGLYLNAGWCYGGFKACPASGSDFAHLIAKDVSAPTSSRFRLDRFAKGYAIDEKGVGPFPKKH